MCVRPDVGVAVVLRLDLGNAKVRYHLLNLLHAVAGSRRQAHHAEAGLQSRQLLDDAGICIVPDCSMRLI